MKTFQIENVNQVWNCFGFMGFLIPQTGMHPSITQLPIVLNY